MQGRGAIGVLELDDIQGDVLDGLQKNAEHFLLFELADVRRFKQLLREDLVWRLTDARTVRERARRVAQRQSVGDLRRESWLGLNLAFTGRGLTRLLGPQRPRLEAAFERGAADPRTIALLDDPPPASWVRGFAADRIDGVFLICGPDRPFVAYHEQALRQRLGDAIRTVYSETGTVRPGRERGHEHFGFQDGISQPGIRGLDRPTRPHRAAGEGLPGQALVWPGEFVLGYPREDPRHPDKPGPIDPLPAPWAKNGSYMVFRRLEQLVPEFRTYVAAEAARLGMPPELLAARMVGRWKSGAPLELAPLEDRPNLGADPDRNNDFSYRGDPFERACPYAAHIRKSNPRDDIKDEPSLPLSHRIIRQGIPFGPEVMPGETRTMHSRGLLFVCYQASIANQFEFIQQHWASNPDFAPGKVRPDSGDPVRPGWDPIIGAAPAGASRFMDEPAPNRRSRLELAQSFVIPTAAAYFFMPSLTALRNVLT
jgi:Dyp-type peroxidase family